VNRVHPRLGDGVDVKPRQLAKLEKQGGHGMLLAKLIDNEEAFMRVVRLEEKNLNALARKIPRHRWVRVPYLEQEAIDFRGLSLIADKLFEA
jgi:hypothetical protein